MHCHALQCFYVDFCGWEWWRGGSRPQRRPTSGRPWPQSFFHRIGASRLIDIGVSVSCPCKVIHLSPTKLGFEIWSRTWKTSLPINNGEKVMESKTGWQRSMDWSWFVSFRRPLKTHDLLGAVVYIRFTVDLQCTQRQSTGKTLAVYVERAAFGKIHTAAITFLHNKMALKITEYRDRAPLTLTLNQSSNDTSRDSILDKLGAKLKWILDLRRLTGFLLGGGGAQCALAPPLGFGAQKSMIGIGLEWHLGLLRMYAMVVGLDDLSILPGAVA